VFSTAKGSNPCRDKMVNAGSRLCTFDTDPLSPWSTSHVQCDAVEAFSAARGVLFEELPSCKQMNQFYGWSSADAGTGLSDVTKRKNVGRMDPKAPFRTNILSHCTLIT